MPREERRARMARMRTHIREHNIYRWAASLIAELEAIRLDAPEDGGRREPMLAELTILAAES
jgi:trehalose-6-phosphate synthase